MGLFGGKKRVTVATQVTRVIKDETLPDSIRTGVTEAIFEGGEITEHVLDNLIGSIGIKADRMYEYAERSYVHGLPTSNISTAAAGEDEIQAILDALEGAPVTVEYCHFGPPNSLHISWMKLVAEQGYDPQTNRLGVLSAQYGRPVYLNNLQLLVPSAQMSTFEPGSLDQWGPVPRGGYTPWRRFMTAATAATLTHSLVMASDTATEDLVRVFHVRGQGAEATEHQRDPVEGFMDLSVQDYDLTADFFHVRYTVGGVTKFWMYQVGTGGQPTLDALHGNGEFVMGQFFPFTYFRYGKQSEIEDTGTEAYRTSKRMLRYLGMDYDMVAANIDENPDIADVEQAMLVMAVPANTTNPMEQRYLYDFFNGVYQSSGTNLSSQTEAAVTSEWSGNPNFAKNSIVIKDRRFKMALSNAGIYKRRVNGSIGKVGSSSSAMGDTTLPVAMVSSDPDSGAVTTVNYNQAVKTHIYRRQVNHAQYDEITVVAMKMLYHVYGHYTVTADETDDILLVPIDRSISDAYSIADREELYARSLHFVFNSVVITKIKWYQSGLFQFILLVVAVVITIYNLGADGGAFLSAIAGGSSAAIYTATMVLLKKFVIGLLIQFAFKLFVKAVGAELALLVAIVAAVTGAVQAFNAGSIAGAPWAQELLQLASGLTGGVKDAMAELFTDLAQEANEFGIFVEAQNSELERAQSLLEGNNRLNPFVIFGEKPEDFYNRTVHSGNVGAMGISAISSYVDIALTLPKINDTLGGDPYVFTS